MMVKLLKNKSVSVGLSVLASVGLVSALAYATSIGNNVSVTGTLTTTGATTLTGAATLSSTLDVTGATTLTSAALSTTLGVTGLATLTGGFVSKASSTHSIGVFNVGSGSLGVATSTPGQELGVAGDGMFIKPTGTTTLTLVAEGSGKGGCIELNATDGTKIRIYATTTPPANTGINPARGLVVEAGACQ